MKLIIGVFLVVCFSGVFGDEIPTIIGYIEPQVARVGFNVLFNCTVSNQGNSEVEWTFFRTPEDMLIISRGTKIETNFNDRGDGTRIYRVIRSINNAGYTVYTLWVYRVQLTDTGVYRCSIRQQGNPRLPFIDADLTVLSPPKIQVSSSTITMNTVMNSSIELVCVAEGSPLPNVTWGRANGKPLPADRIWLVNGTTSTSETRRLTLKNVTEEDRGTYRCSADNNVRPPDDLFTKVNVDFPPKVEYVEENYGAIFGDLSDAILWCKVAGEPSPDLSWYKLTDAETRAVDLAGNSSALIVDDAFYRTHEALQDDQAYTIEQKLVLIGSLSTMDSTFYTLIVHAVAGNEFGWYACSAKNKYGRGHALIRLYRVNDFFTQGSSGSERIGAISAFAVFSSLLFIWTFTR